MKKLFTLAFILFAINSFSQGTYYWVGGASGEFSTSSNWNTTLGGGGSVRTTTNVADILIFDLSNRGSSAGAGNVACNNISANEIIAQLKILQSAAASTGTKTLTFTGTTTTLTITGDLTINGLNITPASAVCTLYDGGNTFSVGGNIVSNASASATFHSYLPSSAATVLSTGKIVLTGSAPVFFSGATGGNLNLGNVEISSTTNASINSAINVLGIYGNLLINVGGKLTQGAKGIQLIATSGVGGTISGSGVIVGSSSSNGIIYVQGTGPASGTQTVGTINLDNTSAASSSINTLQILRPNAITTLGTANNNTVTISGSITLNAGTLNDGGNTINVSGGTMISTTNTTAGAAVYTGTGKINYTRANATAPLFFSTTGASSTYISVGNITYAPLSSTTSPLFNSSTATNNLAITFTGAFNFTRNGSNSTTVTLNSTVASLTVAPTGSITIPTGLTFDFSAKPVLFQSSATSTARLGTITGVLSNATNVTVERYIPLGKRAYRFLTPSVTTSGSIRTNWQNGGTLVNNLGTHITGSTTGANGFDQTTSGGASLFTYDNATGAWGGSVTNTDVNTLTAGTGYRLLVRGDRNVNLTAASQDNMNDYTVLRTTGTVVNGTGAAPVNATNFGVLPALSATIGNFSLVGNPFISPIDWHTVTLNGLEDTYYVWDPNMGTSLQRGRYVSYSIASGFNNLGNTGTSNVGRYIQPGQAFFVKSTTNSPVLTIKESDKASTFAAVFRTQNTFSNLTVSLYEPNEVASGFPIDAATAVLGSNFTQGIGTGDVEKLSSAGENISFKEGSTYLMINARPAVNNNDTMHLQITNMLGTGKGYAFKISASDFDATNQAYLLDAYLQTSQPLNLNGSSVINFSTVNGSNASYAANRFSIVFKTTGTLPVSITSLKAYQKNTGINVEWSVANEINMNSYEVEKSVDGISFNKAGTLAANGSSTYNWFDVSPISGNNYYRIKMIDKNGTTKNTQIVNVKIGGDKNIFTVVTNPVKNKTVVMQLENVEKGSYSIAIYNNAGQQVVNKAIVHNGGSATETIGLGNIAAGTYQLSVLSVNGTRFTKTLLVD